jgi:hypothetical protein
VLRSVNRLLAGHVSCARKEGKKKRRKKKWNTRSKKNRKNQNGKRKRRRTGRERRSDKRAHGLPDPHARKRLRLAKRPAASWDE